jgi:hypothetical protein
MHLLAAHAVAERDLALKDQDTIPFSASRFASAAPASPPPIVITS